MSIYRNFRLPAGRAGAFVTAAVLAALLCGCNDNPTEPSTAATAGPADTAATAAAEGDAEYSWDGPVPAQATVAYIGNFRGFLKPCGCAIQQSGGLLRLGTIMAELNNRLVQGQAPTQPAPVADEEPSLQEIMYPGQDASPGWPSLPSPQPVWLIECGNFAAPHTHYPAQRVQTHLSALALLKSRGFIAAVPGSTELQLSAEIAAEGFAGCPIRLTSCNLASNLAEVQVEPWVEITAGWYLVGVSSWAPAVGDPPEEKWWELSDPVAAAREVIDRLPPGSQVIMVAQHQTGEVVRELAALPVAMLIGHGAENDQQWSAGLAPAYPAPPGKAIRLKLVSLDTEAAGSEPAVRPWEIPLTEEWTDDAEITAVVEGEKLAIREKLLAAIGERGTEGWREVDWGNAGKYLPDRQATLEVYLNAEPIYVGSRECRKCHPDPYQVWKGTTHSHALLTLIQKDEHETLDCLQCHVAGLLEPSGYDPFSSRDEVAGVTCESCHGPGSRHLALATLHEDADDLAIRPGSLGDCETCHDPYNSPQFVTNEYWLQIKHEDKWQDRVQQIESRSNE